MAPLIKVHKVRQNAEGKVTSREAAYVESRTFTVPAEIYDRLDLLESRIKAVEDGLADLRGRPSGGGQVVQGLTREDLFAGDTVKHLAAQLMKHQAAAPATVPLEVDAATLIMPAIAAVGEQLAPIVARLAALEARPPAEAPPVAPGAPLAAERLDEVVRVVEAALARYDAALGTRDQEAAALAARIDQLDAILLGMRDRVAKKRGG